MQLFIFFLSYAILYRLTFVSATATVVMAADREMETFCVSRCD